MMYEKRVQFANIFRFSVELAGKLECPPGYRGRKHAHPFWELIVRSNYFQSIELHLIPPNESHVFCNDSDSTQFLIYIGFSLDNCTLPCEEIRKKLENIFRSQIQFAELEKLLREAFDEPFRENEFIKKSVHVLFESVCDLRFESNPTGDVVEQVKECIRRSSDRMLTVAEIADSFYFSPKYLGRLFREKEGMGILQYQKKLKMEKAMQLLCDGRHTVTDIAYSLGYENVQYFSNTFHQYYGLSPSQIYEKKL